MTYWRDFSDTVDNAARGVFTVDQPWHRAMRAEQEAQDARVQAAYDAVGMDRAAAYRRIAADMEGHMTGGVWARSTGEYAARVSELDRRIARRAWYEAMKPQAQAQADAIYRNAIEAKAGPVGSAIL